MESASTDSPTNGVDAIKEQTASCCVICCDGERLANTTNRCTVCESRTCRLCILRYLRGVEDVLNVKCPTCSTSWDDLERLMIATRTVSSPSNPDHFVDDDADSYVRLITNDSSFVHYEWRKKVEDALLASESSSIAAAIDRIRLNKQLADMTEMKRTADSIVRDFMRATGDSKNADGGYRKIEGLAPNEHVVLNSHFAQASSNVIQSVTNFTDAVDIIVDATQVAMSRSKPSGGAVKCLRGSCDGIMSRSSTNATWLQCYECATTRCLDCDVTFQAAEHECDSDTLKALAGTKHCPDCFVRIYKVDGCDEMWCTRCHFTFSWLAEQEVAPDHNPDRVAYLRKVAATNGVDMPREHGDVLHGMVSEDSIPRYWKGKQITLALERLNGLVMKMSEWQVSHRTWERESRSSIVDMHATMRLLGRYTIREQTTSFDNQPTYYDKINKYFERNWATMSKDEQKSWSSAIAAFFSPQNKDEDEEEKVKRALYLRKMELEVSRKQYDNDLVAFNQYNIALENYKKACEAAFCETKDTPSNVPGQSVVYSAPRRGALLLRAYNEKIVGEDEMIYATASDALTGVLKEHTTRSRVLNQLYHVPTMAHKLIVLPSGRFGNRTISSTRALLFNLICRGVYAY